jgi:hypothetical protein
MKPSPQITVADPGNPPPPLRRIVFRPGSWLQALRVFMGPGVCADVGCKVFDPALCVNQPVSQQAQCLARGRWQVCLFAGGDRPRASSATPACPRSSREQTAWTDAKGASQIASVRVVGLRGRTAATVLLTVCLPALDIALHGAGLHEPNLMPEVARFARPVMRAGAGFHADQAGRQAPEDLQHPAASQLTTQDRSALGVRPVQLENRLRQIDPDCGNPVHGWSCRGVGGNLKAA